MEKCFVVAELVEKTTDQLKSNKVWIDSLSSAFTPRREQVNQFVFFSGYKLCLPELTISSSTTSLNVRRGSGRS